VGRLRAGQARRRPVRGGVPLVVLAFCLAVPTSSPGDVLRLDPLPGREDAGAVSEATVLAVDGTRRALPPLRLPGAPYVDAADLFASPDGRFVAVTTSGTGGAIYVDQRISLVTTAAGGGPPRTLRVDGRAWLKVSGAPVWSADGRELVLGAVRPVLPRRDGHRRLGASRVVRCVAATARCTSVPGSGPRVAAPLPDGRVVGIPVTWPARERRTPCGWRLFLVEGSRGSGFAAGGRCDDFLTAFLRRPVTLEARVFSPGGRSSARALAWTSSLRRGIPRATTAVASSTGVLIERESVDLRRVGPRSRPELESSLPAAPAVVVAPSGAARTVPAPYLASASGRRRPVAPMYALPDGSWLGSVDGHDGGRQASVLTVTPPSGRTRAVRVAGADATPYGVARAAGVELPRDDVRMSLAGYERATNSAVVVVAPIPRATAARAASGVCTVTSGCPPSAEDEDPEAIPPGALVRVPLDGSSPTAVEPVADADSVAYVAW
jgi:hypothetical protein